MPATNEKMDPVDICIVGCGAGGGVLAYELAARKRSVTVLEVGSRPSRASGELLATRPETACRGPHPALRAFVCATCAA